MNPPRKILIVEDHMYLANVERAYFEQKGYEVFQADDGLKGVLLAKKENPDLILLDVMLPKMDGVDVARLIRKIPECRHTPILVMTAKPDAVDRLVLKALDVAGFFPKPFSLSDLLDRIDEILGRSTRRIRRSKRK